MPRDVYTECAAELAVAPDLVAQILAVHVAAPNGWCRAHVSHRERHPCSIRTLAELAGSSGPSSGGGC